MKLSVTTQESLLALLCYDEKHAKLARTIVPPKLYDVFYRDLAMAADDYVTRYNEPPGEHTLDLVLKLAETVVKDGKRYKRIYASLQEIKRTINPAFVLKEATVFARHQQGRVICENAWTELEKDTEAGVEACYNEFHKAGKIQTEMFDRGTLFTDHTKSLAFLDEKFDAIPTGIKTIDRLGMGPAMGKLWLVAGAPKKGKSWALLQLAKWAILSGYRVAYVSMEMSEATLSMRAFQSFFAMTKREQHDLAVMKFRCDELGRFTSMKPKKIIARPHFQEPHVTRRLIKLLGRMEHRPPLLFKKFPMRSVGIKEIDAWLDGLEATSGWLPQLLIVDYLGILRLDMKNYRHSAIEAAQDLRGLADRRQLAAATAWQLNRASLGKRQSDEADFAEAYEIAAQVDTGFTYNQTPDEHALGLARLHAALERGDEGKFTALISQAYAMGQFCIDDVRMQSNYWSVLEGVSGRGRDEDEDE